MGKLLLTAGPVAEPRGAVPWPLRTAHAGSDVRPATLRFVVPKVPSRGTKPLTIRRTPLPASFAVAYP